MCGVVRGVGESPWLGVRVVLLAAAAAARERRRLRQSYSIHSRQLQDGVWGGMAWGREGIGTCLVLVNNVCKQS